MWGNSGGAQHHHHSQQNQKHDIFVGNLSFNTTEDQLMQVFSEVGRVLKVRMVTDIDTGKPRGFAFVEFQDPQAALSAIRNMNDYELNGRRMRVNFSNSSHLEALAGKLGMDMPNHHHHHHASASASSASGGGAGGGSVGAAGGVTAGTQALTDAFKGMSKAEMYDVVAKLKEIAEKDPEDARRILSGHPQLPEAILFCMSKLDMVQQQPAAVAPVVAPVPTPQQPPLPTSAPAQGGVVDPRQRAMMDPRQRAMDPRQAARAIDPRARSGAPPPPPPAYPPPLPSATAAAIAATPSSASNLDPGLVQQIMSLTPQQIAQLPPDKQQSIMTLRNQITGGR